VKIEALYCSLIFILTSSFVLSETTIVINEIMFNPLGSEKDNEWVELYNYGDYDVNITNWKLTDQDGSGDDIVFPEIVMPNNTYLIVFNGHGINELDFSDGVGSLYMNKSVSTWNNGGDDVLLKNSSDYPIDYVSYIDNTATAIDPCPLELSWDQYITTGSEGKSLALFPNGVDTDSYQDWAVTYPTLGKENQEAPLPDINESQVIIEEIYYYPYPNRDNEYLKITNPTDVRINISLWYVTNIQSKVQIPGDTYLNPKQSIYITETGATFYEDFGIMPDFEYIDTLSQVPDITFGSWIRMSNNGATIILEDEFENTIDVVSYGVNYTGEGWDSDPIPLVDVGQILVRKKNELNISIDTDTYHDWMAIPEDPKRTNLSIEAMEDLFLRLLEYGMQSSKLMP